MESQDLNNGVGVPKFSLNLDFENFENETPLFGPFVDSYYSPRGPHDRTPDRFFFFFFFFTVTTKNITGFWSEFGYSKYLIVFCHASAVYQGHLVSQWVFWLDCLSPKYKPWLRQSYPICRRSVSKRYDEV